MLCGVALALIIATPKRKARQTGSSEMVLVGSLLAIVVVALFKCFQEQNSDTSEAVVLVAQVALVVSLLLPRSQLEAKFVDTALRPWTLVLLTLCLLAITSQLDMADSHEKKLVRIFVVVLPWIVARVCLWKNPLVSPPSMVALVAATSVYLLQFEKTLVAAVSLMIAPLFLDRRVRLSRRIAGFFVLIFAFAAMWGIVLRDHGYEGISHYWSARVVKDGHDQERVLGFLADGGRFSLWADSLELWSESPVVGMPLGRFKAAQGYDEHNAFIFYFARTGLVGFGIAIVLAIYWVSSVMHHRDVDVLVARSVALFPTLLFASVGNYFCDADYLLALILASRLVPPLFLQRVRGTTSNSRLRHKLHTKSPTSRHLYFLRRAQHYRGTR